MIFSIRTDMTLFLVSAIDKTDRVIKNEFLVLAYDAEEAMTKIESRCRSTDLLPRQYEFCCMELDLESKPFEVYALMESDCLEN